MPFNPFLALYPLIGLVLVSLHFTTIDLLIITFPCVVLVLGFVNSQHKNQLLALQVILLILAFYIILSSFLLMIIDIHRPLVSYTPNLLTIITFILICLCCYYIPLSVATPILLTVSFFPMNDSFFLIMFVIVSMLWHSYHSAKIIHLLNFIPFIIQILLSCLMSGFFLIFVKLLHAA